MNEVKPCPFCGHDGKVEKEEPEIPTGEEWYRVICDNCGGNSGWLMWPEAAIRSWNQRYGS